MIEESSPTPDKWIITSTCSGLIIIIIIIKLSEKYNIVKAVFPVIFVEKAQ